ncbi:MAG TPA: hypothetical protein VJ110_02090 [Candidatus Nanoarchaeia archaeon]|nr:hypothetical protein [Candidatus Nanoarchaeia archaeon]
MKHENKTMTRGKSLIIRASHGAHLMLRHKLNKVQLCDLNRVQMHRKLLTIFLCPEKSLIFLGLNTGKSLKTSNVIPEYH